MLNEVDASQTHVAVLIKFNDPELSLKAVACRVNLALILNRKLHVCESTCAYSREIALPYGAGVVKRIMRMSGEVNYLRILLKDIAEIVNSPAVKI